MKEGRAQKRYRKERTMYIHREIYIVRSLFFLIILTVVVIFGTCSGAGTVSAQDSRQEGSGSHKYYRSIEVQSGDTLWDIAELYMDDSYHSVSEYMNELIEINQLGSGRIHEGRYLTVVYQL